MTFAKFFLGVQPESARVCDTVRKHWGLREDAGVAKGEMARKSAVDGTRPFIMLAVDGLEKRKERVEVRDREVSFEQR